MQQYELFTTVNFSLFPHAQVEYGIDIRLYTIYLYLYAISATTNYYVHFTHV